MKKSLLVITLTLVFCMMFTFCACGGSQPETTTAAQEETTAAVQGEKTQMSFEAPVLVVSVGKSADITIAKSIMDRISVEYKTYEGNDGETLDLNGVKTVVIVPGVSTKGLGEAGIKIDDELEMTKSIVSSIEASDAKVLVAHLGGGSRRDELTDQFIDIVLPAADGIIALEDGNADGKFTGFAASNSVDCDIVASFADLITSFQAMFTK